MWYMWSVFPLQSVLWCFFPGYLHLVCKLLKENLDKMPGDLRTQIGFITFDSTVHFYSLKVGDVYLIMNKLSH